MEHSMQQVAWSLLIILATIVVLFLMLDWAAWYGRKTGRDPEDLALFFRVLFGERMETFVRSYLRRWGA